jgi:tyrosine-protein kinase Etk/Wzc
MATSRTNKKSSKNNKSLFSEVIYKYLPYWPMFVIFVILALTGAWFYLRKTAPEYEISASIMLKDEKKGSSSGETVEALDPLRGNKIVENELEVLQSKTLMTEVVERLGLYASFYEESNLAPKSAYVTSPISIVAANPKALSESKKVPFDFLEKDSLVVINSKKYPLNQFVQTDFGELKFVPNKKFTTKASAPLYFTITNPKVVTEDLLTKLRAVSPTKLSTVVSLTTRDTDPTRGEDILNELIYAYNRATIEDKKRLAASTFDFVESRLKEMEKNLKSVEQEHESYRASRGAIDISSQGQLYLETVNQNDRKIAEIEMQLAVLDQVQKYVESKDGKGSIVPSTIGLEDQRLSKLLDQLYTTELEYDKRRKTTAENHPSLVAVNDEINKIKPDILENIKSQRASLAATKQNLYSTNQKYSSMLSSIPQQEKDLIDISRQQSINNGIYAFLLKKKEESELSIISDLQDSRIIDKAHSSLKPVSPKSGLIYIVSLILAFTLPAVYITAKEFLNRKILFRNEIEDRTSTPIIGEIIFNKSKEPIVIEEGKRTFIAEQFRRIRVSLGYLGVNNEKKRILVTSSIPGEGKSFVALNLALSLALTGRKVVLLELDLANPSLSTKLDVSHKEGVSNYLQGENEPEEIIKRSSVNNNLFFIPCGSLPDNPSELLLNDRLKTLLEYLDEIFDHVIIDSAPAGVLSDAYVLSPLSDATLYVVKHGYTPKVYLERLDEENEVNQLKNLGIIFNGIRSRGFTSNGYGYGYGYGYVYNTGKKKDNKKAY